MCKFRFHAMPYAVRLPERNTAAYSTHVVAAMCSRCHFLPFFFRRSFCPFAFTLGPLSLSRSTFFFFLWFDLRVLFAFFFHRRRKSRVQILRRLVEKQKDIWPTMTGDQFNCCSVDFIFNLRMSGNELMDFKRIVG